MLSALQISPGRFYGLEIQPDVQISQIKTTNPKLSINYYDRRLARQHGLLRLGHHRGQESQFEEFTVAGISQSHVHDVQITKEALN